MSIRDNEALQYHSSEPAGKVSVVPTKPCRTQRDLSLAYTPGVAVPCLEIARDPSLVYYQIIGGVPWQLLAQDPFNPNLPLKQTLDTADWRRIIGNDPSKWHTNVA